jgi:hypothetical protein
MADVIISSAPDVEALAEEIIDTEDEFQHLRVETVVYIFRDKANKKLGKTVLGTAEVVRGKNAHLYWKSQGREDSPAFFRITIAEDIWENLEEDQRKWLLRHELRHCGIKHTDKGPRLTLVAHDFELFYADIKDPVMASVCQVIKAVKDIQKTLDFVG